MAICTRATFLAILLTMAVPAIASLKDIHTDKLPRDASVSTALTDAAGVEDFVRVWANNWRYNVPKDEVAARLAASLAKLQGSLASNPDNEELLLLTGLVAHYAYNVDVPDTFDVAVNSLAKAKKLVPEDYRPDWFLGVHRCQTNLVKEGMEELLSIETAQPWEQLSASFWDDYVDCALIANMPAHALRAGDRAVKLKAPLSTDRDVLLNIARKDFTASDAITTYTSRQVWSGENRNSQTIFTSSMFGMSLIAHANWEANISDVNKGLALAQFKIGPHPGKSGNVFPNILVVARQPKETESLNDFVQSFFHGKLARPLQVRTCPAQVCLAYEIIEPAGYKAEGDAHLLMTVFMREAPEFPGLLFEQPAGFPELKSNETKFLTPTVRLRRLKGTLYYFVAIDTANSVLENAKKEYAAFLGGITVE